MAVHHPVFGEGEIIATRYGGLEAHVAFEDGISRWIRTSYLTGTGPDARLTPRRPARNADGRKDFDARRMIEAFRLGIVPQDLVDTFTFGRDREIKAIVDWLAGDDPTLILLGEYGAGKTHLLQHAFGKALREGFAVTSVQIDPAEAPFHNPKRVYRQIVRNLRYGEPGDSKGFRDFLKKALNKGGLLDHRYFRLLLHSTPSDGAYWEWIEASESAPRPYLWRSDELPGLYDYSTAGNVYCNLISALGWAAVNALDLKGLVILFDEAEAIDASYWNSYQSERADNFLRALLLTASNRRSLVGYPWESGLTYCQVGAAAYTPFLYRVPSGLKLIFAFTPTAGLHRIRELRTVERVELEALDRSSLKQVFEGVRRLYGTAYPSAADGSRATFAQVAEHAGGTRLFVKASVEALDLARFP